MSYFRFLHTGQMAEGNKIFSPSHKSFNGIFLTVFAEGCVKVDDVMSSVTVKCR